jgi:hypothetical protein
MSSRYGVSIASYGGMSWRHAELTRELARRDIEILELRGSPYPEMTRAEQVRQALISDVETLVTLDSHVDVDVDGIERLVSLAEESNGIALHGHDDWTRALEFAAIRRHVLVSMVEAEKRRYSNSAVDTVWGSESVPAVPLASPWNRDGSSLVGGEYLTDSEAFMIRSQRACGSRVSRTSVPNVDVRRGPMKIRLHNTISPITREPGSKFALCIPSFGALDRDQVKAVYQLEKAGMTVFGIHDCPWIDIARSWLAEQAVALGKGVFFLDHDIQFHPNDVLRLCEQALECTSSNAPAMAGVQAVVAGVYCMRKSGRSLIGAFDMPPGPLTFFEGGGTFPALYSGLGFAAIPHDVLTGMDLPNLWCHPLGRKIRPWFALDCSTGFYAGEDVSFCNRVHDLTVKQRQTAKDSEPEWEMTHSGRPARVFLDTRVRLAHRGVYDYGIEDVGNVVPRYQSLKALMTGSRAEAKAMLVKTDELPADERLAMLEGFDDTGYPKTETL